MSDAVQRPSIRVALLALGMLLAGCGQGAEVPPAATTVSPTPASTTEPYTEQRNRMVETGVIAWGISDPAVIAVMREVPRHAFVPDAYLDQAYENHPLPIGHGQTISQPYMVALMTQELEVETGDRVLEIGTGSGYQAAILAQLGIEVYTIEILEPLAAQSSSVLDQLGYGEVQRRNADGYFGWPEAAPFDAIIVTAAPDHVPQPLLRQLKIGGVMVIPVGPVGGFQELWRIVRTAEDDFESLSLGGVRFVPFTREEQSD